MNTGFASWNLQAANRAALDRRWPDHPLARFRVLGRHREAAGSDAGDDEFSAVIGPAATPAARGGVEAVGLHDHRCNVRPRDRAAIVGDHLASKLGPCWQLEVEVGHIGLLHLDVPALGRRVRQGIGADPEAAGQDTVNAVATILVGQGNHVATNDAVGSAAKLLHVQLCGGHRVIVCVDDPAADGERRLDDDCRVRNGGRQAHGQRRRHESSRFPLRCGQQVRARVEVCENESAAVVGRRLSGHEAGAQTRADQRTGGGGAGSLLEHPAGNPRGWVQSEVLLDVGEGLQILALGA